MVLAGVLFEKATYGRHRVWEYDQPSLWVSKFCDECDERWDLSIFFFP